MLRKSAIKNLSLVGRRGIVQSAFSIKEIKELCRIDNLNVYLMKDEFENSFNEES